MIARTLAQFTTLTTKFQPGKISTPKQAEAYQAGTLLEQRADRVAQELLTLKGSQQDLDRGDGENVFISKRIPSGFQGHVATDGEGQVTALDAREQSPFGPFEELKITRDGDRKEVYRHHLGGAPTGEEGIHTEEWFVSDGHKSSYRMISY